MKTLKSKTLNLLGLMALWVVSTLLVAKLWAIRLSEIHESGIALQPTTIESPVQDEPDSEFKTNLLLVLSMHYAGSDRELGVVLQQEADAILRRKLGDKLRKAFPEKKNSNNTTL